MGIIVSIWNKFLLIHTSTNQITKVDCNAFLSESESISFTVQCQKNLIFSVGNLSLKSHLIHHSMLSKHIWLLFLLFFVTAAFIEMIFS